MFLHKYINDLQYAEIYSIALDESNDVNGYA